MLQDPLRCDYPNPLRCEFLQFGATPMVTPMS
jgi:hypothetical protein